MAIRETEPEEISTAPAGHALIPFVNQTIVPSVFFAPNGSDAVLAALKAEVRRQAAAASLTAEPRRPRPRPSAIGTPRSSASANARPRGPARPRKRPRAANATGSTSRPSTRRSPNTCC